MLKDRIAHFQAKVDGLEVAKGELKEKQGKMKVTEYEARMEQIENTIEVYEAKVDKLVKQLPVEVKCSKCGEMAINEIKVRDEEGILLAVKYHHELVPGYVWNCTQVMDYQPIHDYKGGMKKEMAKRPYAFKSREAGHYNDITGRKVAK